MVLPYLPMCFVCLARLGLMGFPSALPNIMGRSLTIPLCTFSQAQLLVETKYPTKLNPCLCYLAHSNKVSKGLSMVASLISVVWFLKIGIDLAWLSTWIYIYLYVGGQSKSLIKGFKNLRISSVKQTSHFKELLAWNSCRISKLWLGFSRKVANVFWGWVLVVMNEKFGNGTPLFSFFLILHWSLKVGVTQIFTW